MPSGRPPGSANAGSVATELLIAIATVGLVGATALGSLGTELGASIADGARPNARASVSVAAGKVESDSPRRTCSGISFCQVARAADWLWDKSGLDSVVEAELDGAFWRTRESAGKPLWTRYANLLSDVITLPLQIGGNGIELLQGWASLAMYQAWHGRNMPHNHADWAVPTDADGPLTLFRDNNGDGEPIELEDIEQGQLASCAPLATLAALTVQNPDLIRDAIRDNGDGTYTVTFWEQRPPGYFWEADWTRREVTVDATVPVDGNGRPLYAAAVGGELWPLIVEKAWATFRGGYHRIEGDPSFGPLEALTRHTSTTKVSLRFRIPFSSAPSIDGLRRMLEGGEAILAGTGPSTDSGIVVGHYYYVKSVTDDDHIVLGNPWGVSEGDLVLDWNSFNRNFPTINHAPTR